MLVLVFYWLSLACYVVSGIAYCIGLVFSKERFRQAGFFMALIGIVFQTVSLALRWSIAGHGPYMNTFEILSSNTWIAVVLFLLFQWRLKSFINLGAVVMPLAFIMMGFAIMGSTEVRSLPPTLRSSWLLVHIIFAKLTVASLLIAVSSSVFFLFKSRKSKDNLKFLAKLPSASMLDDYGYRMTAFGFITLTIMIITGSIWANYSWGDYWAWDPAETWSLVVWFVYGIYLHGRITFQWKGEISAWYIIFSFVFAVMAFFIFPYFVKGLHSSYMIG